MDPTTSREELHNAIRVAVDAQRQQAVEDRKARDARRRRKSRDTPLYVGLVATWGLLAWLWIARPDAVFNAREAPPALSPAKAEARARYALYLQRSRLEAFRHAHGRLPNTLRDAGPVEDGVTYQRAGNGYVLTRDVSGNSLRLTNTMAVDSFLGSSLDVLRAD